MKKITLKTYAKVNLTLDILGKCGEYHTLKSLISPINLYDVITVTKRKDKKISLNCFPSVGVIDSKNNAYKAAELFINTFNTSGVNIKIKKGIPVGGGLGGSSSDIVGVLTAMKKLFKIQEDVVSLGNMLGSDVSAMFSKKPSIMTGRGEVVQTIDKDLKKLYLILIKEDASITSRESYMAFDNLNALYKPCTDIAVDKFLSGDIEGFSRVIKNDLYLASRQILPVLSDNLKALFSVNALTALMTGSGSTVYGIFEDKKKRDKALKKLKKEYKNNLIKSETL